MERIASFCVDHTKLEPGIYISRIDGDIVTYDIRMRKPNTPPFLSNPVLHSFEHLFATIARNSEYGGRVIYFGPMGCRTGCYFLVRNMEPQQALDLIKSVLKQIGEYSGPLPGNTAPECGNYLEHDLEGAKKEASEFYDLVRHWTVEKMSYEKKKQKNIHKIK